jgi:four helix bundle protein
MIYKLTNNFPDKEKFGLATQMNRAAVSITSNIAEGFTRVGKKEKRNFYYMAKASLIELQNQLFISKDLAYIQGVEFDLVWNQTIAVHKLITAFIKGIINLKSS